MDHESDPVRTQHGRNIMADVTVAQEEVRKIEEWREHEVVRSHPEDRGDHRYCSGHGRALLWSRLDEGR